MNTFIDAALQALHELYGVIDFQDERLFEYSDIGAGGDRSSGFDLLAEAIFVKHLGHFGTIYSEESGVIGEGEDAIILDPIDGSNNILSRFPYYGASIALKRLDKTVAAIVCNFATKECFVRDETEYYYTLLDDFTCKNRIVGNDHAKIGLFEKSYEHLDIAGVIMEHGFKYRTPGALALSLAYAPYVKYVLFLGTMRPYDIEAGLYLCKDLHCYSDNDIILVAKDRDIFEKLSQLIIKSKGSS